MVLYNPKNQNIGIAINTDIKAGLKYKSLNKINSSNLRIKAIQVDKVHKAISVIIAIMRFEYRGSDEI